MHAENDCLLHVVGSRACYYSCWCVAPKHTNIHWFLTEHANRPLRNVPDYCVARTSTDVLLGRATLQ